MWLSDTKCLTDATRFSHLIKSFRLNTLKKVENAYGERPVRSRSFANKLPVVSPAVTSISALRRLKKLQTQIKRTGLILLPTNSQMTLQNLIKLCLLYGETPPVPAPHSLPRPAVQKKKKKVWSRFWFLFVTKIRVITNLFSNIDRYSSYSWYNRCYWIWR